ncbi:sugar phosphate isomerase/epimerase family protein [Horticoccus sp. 23ND18S-11]|uniref:sugar phosphate isomerase/epimerase family protein n=1 Tax=Horticoccus sp. 23ND18S-11 TaxID=3391832 RepID=UPI0039C8EEF4
MKKSISVWSFPFDWPLERKLALARDAGFSGFEVDLTENGPVGLTSSDAELAAVRRQFDAAGLVPSGLATGLYWGANAASADPAMRARAEQILRAQIRCAQQLGIDAILVVPGAVGVDFIPGAEVVPYADAYDRALDFVRRLAPVAAAANVSLCIENVWNKFLLSPLEFRSFIDTVGSAAVGAYFDAGNTLLTGYPEHWIDVLGPRIRRVHFKDYRRAVGSVDGFCDLLSGDVNWPAVMRALRSIRYDGWIAAEMIPPVPFYKHCPEILIHNTSRALDAIFALGRD